MIPLSGKQTSAELEGWLKEARAGSGVLVPRGTPHTYWNPGPGPTRYLLIMTANIYQLIQDIHAMKERTQAALSAVFMKHDSELVKA